MAPREAVRNQPAAGPFEFKASRGLVPQRAFCRFKRGRGEEGEGISSFGTSIFHSEWEQCEIHTGCSR